jgi:hypothetical protein
MSKDRKFHPTLIKVSKANNPFHNKITMQIILKNLKNKILINGKQINSKDKKS